VYLLSLLLGSTRSRQREFDALRAAGATRANVVAIITLSGGLVAVLGALIGIAVGAAWSSVTCSFLSESIGWRIDPQISADIAIWIFLGAASIAVVGSLLPALYATRAKEFAPTPAL
jgi:putative ABC transport system permease protein